MEFVNGQMGALTDGTLIACFDYLAWALNALLEGKIPEHGHRGNRHPEAGRNIQQG